ncbi:MAG TPA: VanZ family protein [Gemmatimonadales bacterium]|nr:VanZ family protein [Gemmatimonadales bacterium]
MTLARVALAVALACILGATLTPAGTEFQPDFVSCIICGNRGWADAVANLLLYAPLGAALFWNGRAGLRAVGMAFLLSACIELGQTFIPGRDPSLGDVTFNTLGAGAGQIAALLARRWLIPGDSAAVRAALAAAAAATGVLALTGALLAPAFPSTPLSVWYAPALPEMPWYHARVLAARLGGLAIQPGLLPSQTSHALRSGEPLLVTALAGPRVPALAPLIVFEDDHATQVYLVGPDGNDLVVRYQTRATTWGLDWPDIRLRGALAGSAAGDTLRIGIHRRRVAWCLSLNQLERCGLGSTGGDAWALVMFPRHWPPWSHTLLGAMWIGGLALPIGLWTRPRVASAAAVALFGGALAVVPPLVELLRTPAAQWCGAAVGWTAGFALQALLRHRARLSATGS